MGEMTRAERNIAWCEEFLFIPEGKFVGQPLVVADFMRDDFRLIYDNEVPTRTAIFSRPRKNAKTVEAAMIVFLHLVGPEAGRNQQMYCAAQSRDQAAVLFEYMAQMVRMSPRLATVIDIREASKMLRVPELGNRFIALSAEAKTKHGKSPALIVHDELGQVRGPKSELFTTMETACAAHENPLSVIISTQAATDADLLSVLIDDALEANDPATVVKLDTAPEDADPFDEATIRDANPAYDVFMNTTELKKNAEKASRMPSFEAEFRNLHLNQRIEVNDPFLSASVWKQCGDEIDEDWSEFEVFGGLDLSEVRDLTAFVAVGYDKKRDIFHTKSLFWLPSNGLREKARTDRVAYDVWARDGDLETVPGASINYDWVAHRLRQFFDEHNIRKVAFDRFNMRHLVPCLERAGFSESDIGKFEPFGQGFVSMSPAMRTLESVVLDKRLRHGNHPVLSMCAANATVISDEAGNRKLSKKRSTGRIDGMVALLQAISVANDAIEHEEQSYIESGELLVL